MAAGSGCTIPGSKPEGGTLLYPFHNMHRTVYSLQSTTSSRVNADSKSGNRTEGHAGMRITSRCLFYLVSFHLISLHFISFHFISPPFISSISLVPLLFAGSFMHEVAFFYRVPSSEDYVWEVRDGSPLGY